MNTTAKSAAIEAYKRAIKAYCATGKNWVDVCKATAECHRNGITDDELIEVDTEMLRSAS